MNASRDEARRQIRSYLSRSGMTTGMFAEQVGFSPNSVKQFISAARYGDGDGHLTAEAVLDWISRNPLPAPQSPGKLYETHATREMDAMLAHVENGGWGILYGPSGAQKSFLLEYRYAQAAAKPEPGIVYIRSSPAGMTPNVLLRRISAGLGACYAQSTESIRQSVLLTIRRRRASLALVLDEADALDRWVETLETLREIGDLARARIGAPGIGILMAGNERVMDIFRDRRGVYFEKWRGRIEQKELRVLGPSPEEAARILEEELGALKEQTRQAVIERCMVTDPVSHRGYVNMHRLWNAIRQVKTRRGVPRLTVN
jgi:hypothetical protein